MLSGNTSLIVRDGILDFCDDVFEEKGINAASSPEGPPNWRFKTLRFSVPNKFSSVLVLLDLLGPGI